MLRSTFQKHFRYDWPLGFGLILLFGSLRFWAVVYGIESGNNQYLSITFCLMIILPFALLKKVGRRDIGWRKPSQPWRLMLTILLGGGIAWLIHLLGTSLYGNQVENWFWYIGDSYPIDIYSISASEKQTYFWVFALIGMSFSPFGEELFYRGLVHGTFKRAVGDWRAALIDSLAFALVHLSHFGLVFYQDQWTILALPAFIWMGLMFLTGMTFNFAKWLSHSIAGAILAHMAFNVMMTYLIFYHLGPAS